VPDASLRAGPKGRRSVAFVPRGRQAGLGGSLGTRVFRGMQRSSALAVVVALHADEGHPKSITTPRRGKSFPRVPVVPKPQNS
jgi:hypothetical protein